VAKKKEEKDEKKKHAGYSSELVGLLLILVSIIGLGVFGPIGNIINGFAVFIAGNCSFVALIFVFGTGLYMIVKRKNPEFFTARLVGLYILLLAVLIYSHINYVKINKSAIDVFKETINQLIMAFSNSYSEVDAGGGIIGAIFAILTVKLFSFAGAYIVIIALLIFGLIMVFNVSLADSIKWIIKHVKKLFKIGKINKEEIERVEEEYEKDNKVVVSSLDELTQYKEKEALPSDFESNGQGTLFSENSLYSLPPMTLLNIPKKDQNNTNLGPVKGNIEVLERVLQDFDISGKVVATHIGPSVTQYELELKAGTKVNRVLGLDRELALALAAKSVHIQAPIPGKNTIGIEIPNRINTMVCLREILMAIPSSLHNSKLLVALGKDIMGNPIYAEINKAPHLLVAGATGSGKSVCINSMIISMLMRSKPDEVKLLLIDPKKVELSVYNGIPHLLAPVVTDPKKASIALMKIVSEMEHRYDLFNSTETKNIAGYNQYVENKNKHLSGDDKIKKLPYIVVIIDELADLMLIAAKEVEESILRITQMARAAGIHLIVATQRPSTEVITGIIKANINSRIAFAVSSNVDSRTILDMAGAEKLLGKGDMLFKPIDENMPIRLQGTFISEEDIKKVVDFTVAQQKAQYDERLTVLDERTNHSTTEVEEYDDPLYNEIVEFVIRSGKVSASLLQRKYRLGYNRAARIIDLLEERGIIGPPNGSKPREVLVKLEENNEE
jgi:S-DNA-T family DNA segregation ATPase FtsK/SpoIIIE